MPADGTGIDRVFAASPLLGDRDPLAPVQRYISRVRATYGSLPAPDPRADLAAIFRDDESRAAVVPITASRSPAVLRVRSRRLIAVLAAMLATAVLTTVGLAAAGTLPGPIQGAVHDLLSHVGINVPDDPSSPGPPPGHPSSPLTPASTSPSNGPASGRTGTTPTTPATPTPTTALPSTTVPPAVTTPTTPPLPTLPPIPPLPTIPVTLPPITLPQLPGL